MDNATKEQKREVFRWLLQKKTDFGLSKIMEPTQTLTNPNMTKISVNQMWRWFHFLQFSWNVKSVSEIFLQFIVKDF